MRNVSYLRVGKRDVGHLNNLLALDAQEDAVSAALYALEEIGTIVSSGCFAHPDTLTRDGIMDYALALMRVRECAGVAGMERLMDACDALAVTVSRLIDDQTCANDEKCEALTRFVAHAQAIIERSAGTHAVHVVQATPARHRLVDVYAQCRDDITRMFEPVKSGSGNYHPA